MIFLTPPTNRSRFGLATLTKAPNSSHSLTPTHDSLKFSGVSRIKKTIPNLFKTIKCPQDYYTILEAELKKVLNFLDEDKNTEALELASKIFEDSESLQKKSKIKNTDPLYEIIQCYKHYDKEDLFKLIEKNASNVFIKAHIVTVLSRIEEHHLSYVN